MKNHRFSGLVLVLCGWLLIGCGPSHQRVPVLETGRVLHLAVKLPKDKTADANGTVYYSLPKSGGVYTSEAMKLSGRNLIATVDTRTLLPGDRVAYYFDVFAGGEATSLGTPPKPYITDIVDYTELVQRSVSSGVSFGKAGQPVEFHLDPKRFSVGKAVVTYTIPDLPGVVTQSMAPVNGKWVAEVPGLRVAAGTWSWRIEAEIEGIVYTHPVADGGVVNFTVPR